MADLSTSTTTSSTTTPAAATPATTTPSATIPGLTTATSTTNTSSTTAATTPPTTTDTLAMDTPTASTSTLYPKILGDMRTLTKNLDKHLRRNHISLATPIPMTGTVKLHGTHADIRVYSTGALVPQSRNNAALTVDKDNFDFAKFCAAKQRHIFALAKRIHARWAQQHPGKTLAKDDAVVLAGEWIGDKIQQNRPTAISDLSPRRFVLCGARVGGAWLCVEAYADICDEEAGIYNISRGGFFRLSLSLRDGGEAFLAQAKALAEQVHASCPFGSAMGVEGPGEGIVWNPAPGQRGSVPNEPAFWIKVKAEAFEERHSQQDPDVLRARAQMVTDREARIEVFVAGACHERRLEQGWDYLREMHVEQGRKGTQTFLMWVVKDIEVEEENDIRVLKLGKAWKGAATKAARDWYQLRIEGEEDGGAAE